MKRLALNIPGGGGLEVHGSLDDRRVVLMLSRENFQLDDPLMGRLVEHFTRRGATAARYVSEKEETTRMIERPMFARLPAVLRGAMKAFWLLGYPARWKHFSPRYRAAREAIEFRADALRALVESLGRDKEIILLGRSAGGRLATLVADDARVAKVVCIGYPFRHPESGDEPERYEHLARLRTPTLILQGTRDTYGGKGDSEQYPLAPNTTLRWAETDHGFALSEGEWTRVLQWIDDFIDEPVRVA